MSLAWKGLGEAQARIHALEAELANTNRAGEIAVSEWQKALKERDALKARLDGLRAAGSKLAARVAELEEAASLGCCLPEEEQTPNHMAANHGGGRESGNGANKSRPTDPHRPTAAANPAAPTIREAWRIAKRQLNPIERDDMRECEG